MADGFRVLITDRAWPDCQIERDVLLEVGAQLLEAPDSSEATLLEFASGVDAIAACWAQVTPQIVDAAPNCKIVARFGIGLDNIPVEACTLRGIPVTYVPDYCVDEVSDHVMAFLLAFNRRVVIFDNTTKRNGWGSLELNLPMTRLRGLTIGVVGFGRIGRATARKASAFGLKILVADPFVESKDVTEVDAQLVDLNSLLSESDFVTLHSPLNEDTRGMIGAAEFEKMKKDAFLINCARGPLIDETALIHALDEEQIAGAGLDVFWDEPTDPSDPLFQYNVIATPHTAGVTDLSYNDIARGLAANVNRLRAGEPLINCVNLAEVQALH